MASSFSQDPSATATTHAPSQRASGADSLLVGVSRPRWWRELCFVGAIYVIYDLIRNGAPEQVARAMQNARSIVHLEHLLGLDIESGTNAFVASRPALAIPANYSYATLYLVVTISVLVWLYAARPTEYRRARSVLLTMTLLALLGYWLFPLAPPRLLTGGGFVDTVRYFGTWGVTPSDPVSSASNQYAAMPSMHVGWALWSGITLAYLTRSPLIRVLGICYPVATFLVVVATGNHFVLDAVAALVVFLVAAAIVDFGGRKTAQVAGRGGTPELATQGGADNDAATSIRRV